MRIELLKDIVSQVAGPGSVDIVDLLNGKENVNEFLIAKKLDVTINQARNVLYKLAEEGLVSFIRKKDKKNGGWYTYFWTLGVKKSLLSLKKRIEQEREHLNHQLSSKQTKQFYHCVNCGLEISEENALNYDFTCPECGEVFESKDNSAYIKEVEEKVSSLGDKLELVKEEIVVIEKKEEASKERKRKIEEKKKKAERDARRKIREMEKKREAKKLGIKPKKKIKKKKAKRGKAKKTKKGKKSSPKRSKKVVKKKKLVRVIGRKPVRKKRPVRKKTGKKQIVRKKKSKKRLIRKKRK